MTRTITATFLFAALLCGYAASLRAFRTHYVYGFYTPPRSLSEHCMSEFVRLTNSGDVNLTSTRDQSGATWNTNFMFFGCSNITALSLANRSNNAAYWYQWRHTLISPVLAVGAGHAPLATNTQLLYVDRTNGQHWRTIITSQSRLDGALDYNVVGFDRPLPAIEPMPILLVSDMTNYWKGLNLGVVRFPLIQHCQHARVLSDLISGFGYHSLISGDSGSGAFIVISNECVFVPAGYASPALGWFGTTNEGAQFFADCMAVTAAAGHDTNTYKVRRYSLTNWPTISQQP